MAPKKLSGTALIHADSSVGIQNEVAPPISVTTTFRALEQQDSDVDYWNPSSHVYSRYTRDTTGRVERVLSKVLDEGTCYPLTYSSGLAASYAALIHFKPKRIAILVDSKPTGYHGFFSSIEVYKKAHKVDLPLVNLDDPYQQGDLVWLETPLNPTGESKDISYYSQKAHKAGAKILVDSTFAPPPLQFPFKWGADCILHSGTKYLGGHSDLLAGVLVVKDKDEWLELQHDRTYLGSMPGTLESWLLLRSLRTLHVRVPRHSENATALSSWLVQVASTPVGKSFDGIPGGVVLKVFHSSLQGKDSRGFEPSQQLEGGWNATFAILLSNPEQARSLPHLLKIYVPATSLGGVESLIEYRLRADPKEDPRLIRISVGIEDIEDLKSDMREGLKRVSSMKSKL
ncbi:Cys/Met metabolism PLP-dependent enzyme-domain-containing protein [Mycena floridula]|nr:Cys/Met metabolism PLP-dependent enzyme-domain-containing protein [Mycena floridula]